MTKNMEGSEILSGTSPRSLWPGRFDLQNGTKKEKTSEYRTNRLASLKFTVFVNFTLKSLSG
jgi:hypothetical protein